MKQNKLNNRISNALVQGITACSLLIVLRGKSCSGQYLPRSAGERSHLFRNATIEQIQDSMDDAKDISRQDNQGNDWLYAAVDSGNITSVQKVLARLNSDKESGFAYRDPVFPNAVNYKTKKTALGRAIEADYRDIITLLVDNPYIDLNQTGTGLTSLLMAITLKNVKVGELLLHAPRELVNKQNKQLDITTQDLKSGATPLHLSIQNGLTTITNILIHQLPKEALCIQDIDQRTPLHIAAFYQRKKEFKDLFNQIRSLYQKEEYVQQLFIKDKKQQWTVFASTYMGKSLLQYLPFAHINKLSQHLPIPNVGMFKHMIDIVKYYLNAAQWNDVLSEIDMLSVSGKIDTQRSMELKSILDGAKKSV